MGEANGTNLARMELFEGTGCWRLSDMRLKRQIVHLSKYSSSIGAEHYHATFKPKNHKEGDLARSVLREFVTDPDGTISWCTFDGIVRGHPSVNGYTPPTYADFDQAGWFSRKEGLERMNEIKAFWDGYEGDPMATVIHNPNLQPTESMVQFMINLHRDGDLTDVTDDYINQIKAEGIPAPKRSRSRKP
jgi:hypothetical protein